MRQIAFVDLRAQYQSIKAEIDAAVAQVLEQAAFIGGRHVADFEKAFAGYCKAEHCIGVANGTDALHVAMRCAGLGPGDEVLVPAMTFIASSEGVSQAGAQPVFVDVDPDTLLMNPELAAAAVTERTRAILPVHLYGQPADTEALGALAAKHDLMLFEDAAQAHGAEIAGKRIGSLGRAACFSFYPGKNLGAAGDAGAIVTDDADLAHRCRQFADHGRISKYDHGVEGINSRLDGIQAAILSVKLRHLEAWTEARRANAVRYRELLAEVSEVSPLTELPGLRHVYHLFVVRVRGGSAARERIQKHLADAGIASGVHYPKAVPLLSAYASLGHTPKDFPVAFKAGEEILSLPMHPELSPEDIEYIVSHVKQAVR